MGFESSESHFRVDGAEAVQHSHQFSGGVGGSFCAARNGIRHPVVLAKAKIDRCCGEKKAQRTRSGADELIELLPDWFARLLLFG